MEKLDRSLHRMNLIMADTGDDDGTNIFENLSQETKYYLSKNDVIPIEDLLSVRDYKRGKCLETTFHEIIVSLKIS